MTSDFYLVSNFSLGGPSTLEPHLGSINKDTPPISSVFRADSLLSEVPWWVMDSQSSQNLGFPWVEATVSVVMSPVCQSQEWKISAVSTGVLGLDEPSGHRESQETSSCLSPLLNEHTAQAVGVLSSGIAISIPRICAAETS